ncbi:MAG TPA: MFS transporter [Mycobacteriales bacterium]|nr:MFS transporter [Mycobacteriales bacterium]
MTRVRARLAALLAVPEGRDARIFAVAAVVDALGNGLFLPVSALFFVKVTGLPVTRVGLGLGIAGGVGMLGPIIGGPVIDRYGPRRTALALFGVRTVAYASYPLVRGFAAFAVLVSLTNLADTMARPAFQALAATLGDERERVTTLAFIRAIRNIGYGAGGLLVSLALAVGGRGPYIALVLGDAATFVGAALLLARVRDAHVRPATGRGPGYGAVFNDRRFLALAGLHGLLSLHLTILLFGFPLWIDQRTHAPTALAGIIFTMNSALVVLLQVPFSRRSVTVAQGGRALRWSGLTLLLTCVLMAVASPLPAAPAVALLLVVGVVECAAELWEAVGGWAVSLGLAPEALRGRYLGVWSLGFAVHDIFGPILMAWIVVRGGPWALVGLGAVVAAAGLAAGQLANEAAG